MIRRFDSATLCGGPKGRDIPGGTFAVAMTGHASSSQAARSARPSADGAAAKEPLFAADYHFGERFSLNARNPS
jgi:hypothetical protein